MMQKPLRFIPLALAACLTCLPMYAQAATFDLEKTKTTLSAMIEKSIKEGGVPSLSIALVREDKIVWKAAFGYANVRTKTLATPDTIYSTGSTFKAATATALMQLHEQGKLDLDAPVNRYLGDVQIQDRLQSDKQVTTTHILSHWSGLIAGATTQPIWGRELPKTLETMVSGLYSIRAPEVQWEYNNFAYGMAGLMVEEISGQTYEQYMVEHVLKPLGVTIEHPVQPTAEMVELMALPYTPGGSHGEPEAVDQVHFDVFPAGDIFLTAEDMARFLGAHLNGGVFNGQRILSEASIKAMHEPRFGGTYAFGFAVSEDSNGHKIITHTGGIPGQSSMMMGDVDARVGVYFMTNSGGSPAIATAALGLLRGEDYTPPPERKAVPVSAKVLDRYVGQFALSADTVIIVSRQGQDLVFSQGGKAKWALLAESENRFFETATGGMVTFLENDAGKIDRLKLETRGQETIAMKK